MSAGTRSGAKTRLGAAALLAVAITLGYAGAGAGGAATTANRLEVTEPYDVRAMSRVPVHRTQALAHRRESRRNAADRTFGAPTAVTVSARRGASSLSRSDNGRTWLVAAAAIAAIGAFIAVAGRLVRGTRRRRELATAPARSIGSRTTESVEEPYEAGEPASAVHHGAGRLIRDVVARSDGPDAPAGELQQLDAARAMYDRTGQGGAPPPGVTDDETPAPSSAAGEPLIGYVTASSDGGAAADEGEAAIDAASAGAGWDLLEIVRDRDHGSRCLERPGLSYALQKIISGEARGLVVADVRRLCRSMVDLGTLMRWFQDARATLIALDLDLDTSTREGEHAARVLITLGAWEHERIAERTRLGIADVKSRGGSVGRPAISDQPELRERIAAMRRSGMTLQAIADQLNAERVPTMRGGARWRPSSVQGALGYRRPGGRKNTEQLPENAASRFKS